MSIDINAAEQFVYANARLLERYRLAVLLDGASVEPVLATLRNYRNPDGGFGHALEPDVRCPGSQTAATLQALEVLGEIEAVDDPMIAGAAGWLTAISEPDGGVPTVLPSADGYPRAPWMVPSQGSGFLTYALAACLWTVGSSDPWLSRATEWCWAELEGTEPIGGYTLKFAADFLDAVPDPPRAAAAVERLRSRPRSGRLGPGSRGRRGRDDQPARHLTSPGRGLPGVVHRRADRDRARQARAGPARRRRLDGRLPALVSRPVRRVARHRHRRRAGHPAHARACRCRASSIRMRGWWPVPGGPRDGEEDRRFDQASRRCSRPTSRRCRKR